MTFCWDDVKRLKDTHDVPMILKGIATAEELDRYEAEDRDLVRLRQSLAWERCRAEIQQATWRWRISASVSRLPDGATC